VTESTSTDVGTTRRRVVLGVVAALAVAIAVVVGIVVWGGSSGHEVSSDEAGRRIGTATSIAPVQGVLRPEQGVYRYRGSGTDALSTPPKEQLEGPDMPATVTHRPDGCWTFRIDFHSNHWQSWEYCATDGILDERGGSTFQRWDFGVFANETTSTFACDSSVTIRLDAEPGDEWTQTCHSEPTDDPAASRSAGPYRFVGAETLTIGGEPVEALHYHRERTMSGGQDGTEQADVWFAAADALPLRNERRIEVRTDTIIGETTYTEDAEFELQSIEPEA